MCDINFSYLLLYLASRHWHPVKRTNGNSNLCLLRASVDGGLGKPMNLNFDLCEDVWSHRPGNKRVCVFVLSVNYYRHGKILYQFWASSLSERISVPPHPHPCYCLAPAIGGPLADLACLALLQGPGLDSAESPALGRVATEDESR